MITVLLKCKTLNAYNLHSMHKVKLEPCLLSIAYGKCSCMCAEGGCTNTFCMTHLSSIGHVFFVP